MQTFSNKNHSSEYVSQDDESEALRHRQFASTEGFGEILTDEDLRMYAVRDMGLPQYDFEDKP